MLVKLLLWAVAERAIVFVDVDFVADAARKGLLWDLRSLSVLAVLLARLDKPNALI